MGNPSAESAKTAGYFNGIGPGAQIVYEVHNSTARETRTRSHTPHEPVATERRKGKHRRQRRR